MIEAVLPAGVACAESFGDRADAVLFPAEAAAVTRAVDKRRREFATGRACAREALARLGVGPTAIPRGERGAPQWPPGIVGSITHCAGYRAAVAARGTELQAIGIDAEPGGPLPDGVLAVISGSAERARLGVLAALRPDVAWDRLLFSVKESVYKAWFPLTRRWLGFEDADVTLYPDGTFDVRLLVPEPGGCGDPPLPFGGRWLAGRGLLVTAIAVPAGR